MLDAEANKQHSDVGAVIVKVCEDESEGAEYKLRRVSAVWVVFS